MTAIPTPHRHASPARQFENDLASGIEFAGTLLQKVPPAPRHGETAAAGKA